MTYRVPCPCGESIEVLASAAGGGVPCPACGRGVPVPRLSQLREMANLGAYETSAIDTVARLVEEGRLPAGKSCMISGRPTLDWFEVEILCESPYVKKGRMNASFAALVLIVGWLAILLRPRSGGDQYFGRETRAKFPLRIDREHHAKLASWRSRRRLRSLLQSIPEAAQLFSEFQGAKIIAGRGMIDPKGVPIAADRLWE
jgi:hypothetical protein